ncbi:hypothetical protein [Nocardiopsis salina]|uniref:hypothetical protein n=1 Tax=Nocardiopsis salina TaxID=245836 RepID=UPI000344AB57|nr:hypothetical protein [Nocardiopsis salina]
MGFEPRAVAAYSMDDVGLWTWEDQESGAHVGYIADEEEGSRMGLAFVRFRAGVSFDFAWPYDEVSVVTRGSLTVRTGGEVVTAREGEILTQPAGVAGTFEIDEDMEMICVHFPTFARAFGMTLREYKAETDDGREPSNGEVTPRGREWGGGAFDPTRMQVFGPGDVRSWSTVEEEPLSRVGYLADRAEGFPMGMAYSKFARGGVHELSFPYDEVAAVTQGSFTVRSGDRSFRVGPGQMLYMPAGVSAVFEMEEDTVAVGLHHPTFAEAFGQDPHEA